MTVEPSFERVNRESFRDNVSRKVIPNRSATLNEAVLQIVCSRCASLKIIGQRCVPSCLSFRLEKGEGRHEKALVKEMNLYT